MIDEEQILWFVFFPSIYLFFFASIQKKSSSSFSSSLSCYWSTLFLPVLHLDVSTPHHTGAWAAPGLVWKQEQVLLLDHRKTWAVHGPVSSTGAGAAPRRVYTTDSCASPGRVSSTGALAAPGHVHTTESCAAPRRVYLTWAWAAPGSVYTPGAKFLL